MSLTREQSRAIDQRAVHEFGMPSIVLMENAGRGTVDVISQLKVPEPFLICCGTGNNGGDGFVIARHLELRGHVVRVSVWGDTAKMTPDAATNHAIVQKSRNPLEQFGTAHNAERLAGMLAGAGTIIDALLGTGARGNPRPPLDAVIAQLNAAPAAKLAVDLPSGLDCDTGQPGKPTFRADHTCTFVARKIGFDAPGAERYTGQIHVVGIGVPRAMVDQL
ncbi:MAG TPA: NAD(P)H-hydrate epimerase [Pirellulales bacterium]|jgi:NAD(P)H-hydrate epimerase|nr:NAD(P)H-hydrate epimerase [Pirellulales bacterium]